MRRLLALFCVLPLALAACGSSSSKSEKPASSTNTSTTSSSSGSSSTSSHYGAPAGSSSSASGGGQTLKLTAQENGGLSFSKSSLSAKAGKVTLDLNLPGSLSSSHGIAIEGKGVDKDGPIVQAGSSSTVTVTLKPGTYTYYCPVPGHEQAGMKGTLTVS
jgi:uncharacterized cupredoxin-like copper-binding protein